MISPQNGRDAVHTREGLAQTSGANYRETLLKSQDQYWHRHSSRRKQSDRGVSFGTK